MEGKGENLPLRLQEIFSKGQECLTESLAETVTLVDRTTAPLILAFLRENARTWSRASLPPLPTLEPVLQKVEETLKQNTPPSLHHQVNFTIPREEAEDKKEARSNFLDNIQRLVVEALVKRSSYEFEVAISEALGENLLDGALEDDQPMVMALARRYPLVAEEQRGVFVRHVASIIEEKDIVSILTYANKNPDFASDLFTALFLLNEPIYKKVIELISTEKRFFKEVIVSSLPELSLEGILPVVRAYNWNVVAALLRNRPEAASVVVASMSEGRLAVPRRFFVEKVKEQADIFSYYVSELKLTPEELGDVIRGPTEFLQQFFALTASDEGVFDVARVVSRKTDQEIIDFLSRNRNDDKFSTLIKALTGMMRFTGNLREYILDNFARKREFFHTLITYLNMGEIEDLLGAYYEKDTSLEALLRKFHPQELLIEIHRFRNIVLASSLIGECSVSDRFSDADWIFAIKTPECTRSPTRIKTALCLLRKRPQILSQVLVFMRRSITTGFWRSNLLCVGLRKCIEVLGDNSVAFMEDLRKEDTVEILRRFPETRTMLDRFFSNCSGHLSPRQKMLKNTFLLFMEKSH